MSGGALTEFRKWLAVPLEQLLGSHTRHGGGAVLAAVSWVRGMVRSQGIEAGVARVLVGAVLRGIAPAPHKPPLLRAVLDLVADGAMARPSRLPLGDLPAMRVGAGMLESASKQLLRLCKR